MNVISQVVILRPTHINIYVYIFRFKVQIYLLIREITRFRGNKELYLDNL